MPETAPNPISWLKFFIILFAPAILCFLILLANFDGLLPVMAFVGLIGGLLSGLICAGMIVQGLELTGFRRGLAYGSLAIVLCCLSYFLCFLGCTEGMLVATHAALHSVSVVVV